MAFIAAKTGFGSKSMPNKSDIADAIMALCLMGFGACGGAVLAVWVAG